MKLKAHSDSESTLSSKLNLCARLNALLFSREHILPFLSSQNQPPLDHESFSAHRELEALLKKNVRGEVRFDLGSRALYAADSSNYRQLPIGVICPRDAADVEAGAGCLLVGGRGRSSARRGNQPGGAVRQCGRGL